MKLKDKETRKKRKKKSSKSPTQRTLEELREAYGFSMIQVVEYWHHFAKRRIDVFGFIDILAIDQSRNKLIGIQATNAGGHATRIKKIQGIPEAEGFILTGGEIWVYSWGKKKQGKRELWKSRITKFITVRELRDYGN